MSDNNTSMTVDVAFGKGEAGFTLIENLIAIIVLVFGLIAVTNLMLVAGTSNAVANQATAATAAAQQQLEFLKATPFTALVAGGSVTACNAPYCTTTDVAGVGRIQTRWQIVAIDPESYFIRVRSEGTGVLVQARSRAEFTTIRACTDTSINCPVSAGPIVP